MAHDQKPGKPLAPFTGIDSSRNYRAMYRAVCNFHEKHNPQKWRGLSFGQTDDNEPDCSYWGRATDEMGAIALQFDNDPFVTGLLLAVWDELEREYQQMKENPQKPAAEPEADTLQEAINRMFPTG